MSKHSYRGTGYIKDAAWEGVVTVSAYREDTLAVRLTVGIPADDFTGLDLTRPITIIQEAPDD